MCRHVCGAGSQIMLYDVDTYSLTWTSSPLTAGDHLVEPRSVLSFECLGSLLFLFLSLFPDSRVSRSDQEQLHIKKFRSSLVHR